MPAMVTGGGEPSGPSAVTAGTVHEALVVGAGAGGLGAAAMLERAGVPTLVLERDSIGAAWRSRYDRLHLHTHRLLSGLPGYRISSKRGPWVHRDGVVEYLHNYARHHGLDVRTGVEVERVERGDAASSGNGAVPPPRWRLETSAGPMEASWVVMATGYNRIPRAPEWPGGDSYRGELVQASEYRNPTPYSGRDVLVVGTGNTGAEIAVDLVEGGASRVRLSVRTPPQLMLRDSAGLPTQITGILLHRLPPRLTDPLGKLASRLTVGDLSRHGLPRPSRGPFSDFRARDIVPILDVGLVPLIKSGRVQPVAAVERLDGTQVVLADGSRIEPDVVIAATGYTRGLEPLVGHLGVLRPDGRPELHGGRTHPDAPGLHFIGYLNPLSGMFWEMSFEARRIARAVARERQALARSPAPVEAAPAAA